MYYTFNACRSCSSKIHRNSLVIRQMFFPLFVCHFFHFLLLLNLSIQFSRILELNLDARWRLHWVWGFQFVAFINWRGDATLKATLSNSWEYYDAQNICWKVDSNAHICTCDRMQTHTNRTPSVFINRWTDSWCKWWNNEKKSFFLRLGRRPTISGIDLKPLYAVGLIRNPTIWACELQS